MSFMVIVMLMILLGAAMGSFAGATVWRLRARQLVAEKKDGERFNKKEYEQLAPLAKASLMTDRSHCLHCSYALKWYDLIPIASWLMLRGKCRNCHKKIGKFELLIELGMAVFFIGSFLLWPFGFETPLEIARFVIWLAAGVVCSILASYDLKWYLLPDRASLALALAGIATVIIVCLQSSNVPGTLLNALGAVVALSGLYLLLYLVSKGKWVGFGDIKLGFGLALLLADWQLAIVALFLANFIGCLIVIPLLLAGKLQRRSRIPFGPLLILGMIAAQFIGPAILSFYLGTLV